jgi:hypothetical protein
VVLRLPNIAHSSLEAVDQRPERQQRGAGILCDGRAIAVLIGAIVGTTSGIRLAMPMVLKALGAVLIIAGLKLIGIY